MTNPYDKAEALAKAKLNIPALEELSSPYARMACAFIIELDQEIALQSHEILALRAQMKSARQCLETYVNQVEVGPPPVDGADPVPLDRLHEAIRFLRCEELSDLNLGPLDL